jgi:uncharacterized membrane protein
VTLVLGVTLALSGLALLIVGKLSSDERLPRNRHVGVRTASTMATDEAWRAAQRAAGPSIFWAGAGSLAIGIVLATLDSNRGDALALAVVATVWILALVGVGAQRATRAAKAVDRP